MACVFQHESSAIPLPEGIWLPSFPTGFLESPLISLSHSLVMLHTSSEYSFCRALLTEIALPLVINFNLAPLAVLCKSNANDNRISWISRYIGDNQRDFTLNDISNDISLELLFYFSARYCRFARYRFLPAIYRFHFAIYHSSFAIYPFCFAIYHFCFAIYRFCLKRYHSSLSSQHCEIQIHYPKDNLR